MLTERIKIIGAANLAESKVAQILGIFLLIVILIVSTLLVIITRSAITSSHVSSESDTDFDNFFKETCDF